MPQTGLLFEKKRTPLTKRVLDFFERVRYSYLSAKESPSEYGAKWKQTVKEVRDQFDSLDDFSRELKLLFLMKHTTPILDKRKRFMIVLKNLDSSQTKLVTRFLNN